MQSYSFNDSYATCLETHSALRIFSDSICPSEMTAMLDLQPTSLFKKGEVFGMAQLARKANGWFYSTKGSVQSRDTRRHIDQVLDALEPRRTGLQALIKLGCKIDICSYWLSAGHGGPSVEHEQMKRLAELEIGVWWDVYFDKID